MPFGKELRILLVEDEAIIALAEKQLLEAEGYTVETATSGEKAVEAVRSAPPDLVLMDMDLGPGMDGRASAAAILEVERRPIIFLTSHGEREFVERAGEITGFGYVLKNSGSFVLLQSIKMALKLFESEQRTRDSESRYRAAFMTSPNAVNINKLDGTYVDINEGFTALTGFTRDDVIGKSSGEIGIWARPEDRERLVQELGESGKVDELESLFATKDGSHRQAVMSARIITIKGEPHILSVTRDVTAQRKLEEELRREEERYRSIFDNAAEGILLGDSSGQITDANRSACEITGYTEAELLKLDVSKLFSEELLEEHPLRFDLLAAGQQVRRERILVTRDGSHVPVIMNSTQISPNRLQTILHDVSDIRKAESALKESEERFRLAVEGSRDGLWDWNLLTNEAYHSPQFARMLGYEPDDLPYTSEAWTELLHPEDMEDAMRQLTAYLEGTERFYESAFRMQCKDGSYRWISGRGIALRDGHGKPVRIVGFNRDISDQRAREEQIESLLEEKDSLIRETNHRVKNNLAMIMALISLKEQSLGGSADLSDIRNQIDAIRLVHEKFYITGLTTEVEIGDYLRDLLHSVFSLSPVQPVQLEAEIAEGLVPSKLAISLALIVNELATNAIKHGFSPGREARFSLSLRREEAGSAVMEASNNGPPLISELMEDSAGTLGIRLIHALLDQIGATMDIKPTPHPCFTIRFQLD